MAVVYDNSGGVNGASPVAKTTTRDPYRNTPQAKIWGKLSGYSYDVEGSPGYVPRESEEWRRSTRYAKAWMNDGISDAAGMMSESERVRRILPWKKFDRFYSIDLEHEMPSGRHYIFILRPDLYLVESTSATDPNGIKLATESKVNTDPYFVYLAKMHPEIIASLTGDFAGIYGQLTSLSKLSIGAATGSGYGNARTTDGSTLGGMSLPIHTFIPYLTSRIESLQLPDFAAKTSNIVQPYTKYSIPYAQSAIESITGGTFDITFREDRYYSIHKLFYAWIYYQDKVMRNIFQPKKKYLQYNSIDYATSIYDFVVDETGENVLYWAKYTGCIPTNVPMSDLGFNKGSPAENRVSIGFSYFFCEHMDMNILRDFQYNSLGYVFMKALNSTEQQLAPCSLSDTEPMYNAADRLGPSFNGRPVIILMNPKSASPVIKLRWLIDPETTKTYGRGAGTY